MNGIPAGSYVVARTGPCRDWLIRYPSGTELRPRGELVIVWIANACYPAISGRDALLLDPRAIVTDVATGDLVYAPSSIWPGWLNSDMAEWIAQHPEWEEQFGGAPPPGIPLQIPMTDIYVAPRVGTVPSAGRTSRLASCGHEVLLSERGLQAIDKRGKRPICGECAEARAAEYGATVRMTESKLTA